MERNQQLVAAVQNGTAAEAADMLSALMFGLTNLSCITKSQLLNLTTHGGPQGNMSGTEYLFFAGCLGLPCLARLLALKAQNQS